MALREIGREGTEELAHTMCDVTAETTDDELEGIAVEYEAQASARGVELHVCLRECLRAIRDDLRRIAIATSDF